MKLMKNYRTVKCNLCGADNYSVLYEAQYDMEKDEDISVKFRSSGDETLIDRVVKCNDCGLIYINPVLDPSMVLEGYRKGTDETFVSQNEARKKTFTKCLKLIEKYCKKPGKILDVGTAGGAFLHICKQKGWEVSGCEVNEWLCKWGKKNYRIPINSGTLFDQKYKASSFDVITLWDVLEHTPDPKKVLKECNRILKPGGLLIINIPDIGTWIAKLMRRKWVFLLSVHLFYFTKKTIIKMMENSGYEVLRINPHFQFLEFSYIFKRAQTYIGKIALFGLKMINIFGLGKLMIPYWMGQTLFIMRKK